MRLLVVTQTVDENDLQLGFFHRWLEELASRVEEVTVICLKEGVHHLPENVKVYSLGKEQKKQSPIVYAVRFKKLAWKLRKEYDTVFVHMNQEYILIAGPLWKLLGKKIYMWRNHYDGSWLTDVAASYCKKVFCTSRFSYTAKYKKTILMPVGVDTERFLKQGSESAPERKPHSILFFARMAPSKKAEVLIDALKILKDKSIEFTASLYGSPLPIDEGYYLSLKKKVSKFELGESATFYPGVPNTQAAEIFSAHEVFVNCSQSGMFDKTLFEAAASGCLVIAASEDFQTLAGSESYFNGTSEDMEERLEAALTMSSEREKEEVEKLRDIANQQSLPELMTHLTQIMAPVRK
jgi:glycosyltransferase involved in cell wall biosynthesis